MAHLVFSFFLHWHKAWRVSTCREGSVTINEHPSTLLEQAELKITHGDMKLVTIAENSL